MPAKKPPPKDEKPQGERFKEFAKEIGADRDPKAVERAIKRVAQTSKEVGE